MLLPTLTTDQFASQIRCLITEYYTYGLPTSKKFILMDIFNCPAKKNERYQQILQIATLREQVEALGKSGYATDPKYADKVMAIANSKRLEAL